MNRVDFMKQSESLLQNISPEEREEALQYYEDYFNDAGAENEASVIEALGNPAKVAENIKRDLYGAGYGGASGQRNTSSDRALMEYHATASGEKKKEGMSTGMTVLIVILCVLASPAVLTVGGSLIGTLAGILAGWFSLILGFGAAALALFSVTLYLIFVGGMCISISPLTSVAVLGAALICCGIGILFMILTVAMAGIATPAIFRGIVALCKKIFGKKDRRAGA